MKKLLFSLVIALCIISFSACEKDDICVEGDTPLLIVGFFDAEAEDSTTVKAATDLLLWEVNEQIDLNTIGTIDSIAFPLRLDVNTTVINFIQNTELDEEGTTVTGDNVTITFNYEVNRNFVSRACGYVANYNNLTSSLDTTQSNWIRGVAVENPDIEISNAIHVKIFH